MQKPSCQKGQSCGNACIEAADSCLSFVSKAAAQGLLKLAKVATDYAKDNKLDLAVTAASTAVSFGYPAELAFDGDVVSSAVSEAMSYTARQVITQIRKASAQRKAAYA